MSDNWDEVELGIFPEDNLPEHYDRKTEHTMAINFIVMLIRLALPVIIAGIVLIIAGFNSCGMSGYCY